MRTPAIGLLCLAAACGETAPSASPAPAETTLAPPEATVAPTPPARPTREPEAVVRRPGPEPRVRIGSAAFFTPTAALAIAVDGDDVFVARPGDRVEVWRRDGTRRMYVDLGPPPPPAVAGIGVGSSGGGMGGVQALAVSGDRVAAALGAHGAAVFHRETGEILVTIRDLGVVHDVALVRGGGLWTAHGGEAYANGHLVTEATGDCGLCGWSETGARTFTRAAADEGGWVTALVASDDGSTIVTGASDGRLRVHDASGALVREIRSGDRRIERLALTDGGLTIVAANDVGDVFRVGLDGSGRRRLFAGDEITRAAAFGETRLAWAGENGSLRFLDPGGARVGAVYLDGASSLAIERDEILVGDSRGHVRRWVGSAWASPETPSRAIDDLFYEPSGARLWARSGTELRGYSADGALEVGPRALPDFVARVALHAGRLVVQRNAISLVEEDLVTGEARAGAGSGGGTSIDRLAVSGDGAVLAYSTHDRVRVGAASFRVGDGVRAMALSDDGSEIAVTTQGATPRLEVHVVATGETRWSVELEHVGAIVAWRGERIVVAEAEGALPQLRSAADGTAGIHYGAVTGEAMISAIVFSPDGSLLAFARDDGLVSLVDAATGEQRWRTTEHVGPATALAFRPDGSELASAGADGTILVIRTDAE